MRSLLLAFVCSFLSVVPGFGEEKTANETAVVRVMTFNLWVGGDAGGQPLSRTADAIKAAGADVVGLQETAGNEEDGVRPDRARELAKLLDFHYFDQGERRGILSRFPIVDQTPTGSGVEVELPSGKRFWLFNVHFAHAPYQPYQLLDIPYAGAPFLDTAEEAIRAAVEARGHQVEAVLADMRKPLAAGAAVFLTGDFNEPSHLDWTPAAAKAGLCPVPVLWPSTKTIREAGLRDSFRAVHPDELSERGLTWTPISRENDPKDRHDRIDFVFFAGESVEARGCQIVGEKTERADVVVTPYPSDHRAVVSAFLLAP